MAVLAAVAQRESQSDRLTRYLPRRVCGWPPLMLGIALVALVALIRHPLMPVCARYY
jgi:hypothetical protein